MKLESGLVNGFLVVLGYGDSYVCSLEDIVIVFVGWIGRSWEQEQLGKSVVSG
jgi:hypothetical protein